MRALPLLVLVTLLAASLPSAPADPQPAAEESAPLGVPLPTGGGAPYAPPPLPYVPDDDVIVPVVGLQNEFSIAANPLDPDNLVGGANDYSLGDAWAGVYTSFDGGATWTHGYIPLPSTYTVSGDPVLAFDPDGRVYYAGIAFNRGSTNNGANAIFVSHSDDGGLTWTTHTPYTSPSGSPFHDKPWMNIDPATGDVLLSYTHFGAGGGILFSRSSDGGATFTPRVNLGGGQFSLPIAGENGEVYVTWAAGGVARFARSTDGGATFTVTSPLPIALPDIPVPFRYFAYPVLDVARGGPQAGTLYLGGPTLTPLGPDLHVIQSHDGGQSWSQPETLARPGIQFMPWMAIQPDGTVGISYMDTVESPNTWALGLGGETRLSQSLSIKHPLDPVWHTTLLTDEPSPADAATFWGDYQGLAASANGFHPAWGDARAGGPPDFATVFVPHGL